MEKIDLGLKMTLFLEQKKGEKTQHYLVFSDNRHKMEHYDFSKVNSFFDVELHEYQKKAISAILNGLDCFVGQPTASGKSLIFQSIPVIKDGSW